VRLRRRTLLPDEARTALQLQPGERVLAAARVADGGWLVATAGALVGAAGRTPWTEVAHAQWFDEEQVLLVDPVPGAGASLRLPLVEPGRVPETVHERVMASIVLSRRVALPGGGGARLVARRGDDADLVWQVVPDAGTDLTVPAVRSAVDDALARLRGELA
jgi:hypothetical protein